MSDSIWTLHADATDAVKALGSTIDPLTKVATITETISKQGGIAGALAGDTSQLTAQQKIIEQLTDELTAQEKTLQGINEQMEKTADVDLYKKLTTDAKQYQTQIEGIKNELNGINTGPSQDVPEAPSGDMFRPSSLAPLGTASRALNITSQSQQATQIAYSLTAVKDIGDSVGQLKNDLTGVGPMIVGFAGGLKDIQAAVAEGGIASLPEVFTSITAAISPLTLIAGGLIAVLLVVGQVIDALSKHYADVTAAEDDYLSSIEKEADIKSQLAGDVTKGDQQAIQQTIDSAEAQRDSLNAQIAQAQNTLDAHKAALAKLQSASPLEQLTNDPFNQKQADLNNQINDDMNNTTTGLVVLNKQLGGVLTTITDGMKAMSDANAKAAAVKAADNLTSAEASLVQVREQARDAAKQEAASIAQFQDQATYDAQKTATDRQRQDQTTQEQYNDSVSKTIADGQKQIQQIITQSQKTITDDYKQYAKAEADAVTQLNKSLLDANTQYNKTVIKDQDAYQKQSAAAQVQFAKDDLRRQQDLQNNLDDLELQNDVVGYISAKKNADVTETRAQEDYADQQAQAKDAYDSQMQDLKDSLADQKQQLIDSYHDEEDTRKENLDDQLQTEKDNLKDQLDTQKQNLQDQLTQAAAAYKQQQQQTAQQEEWQDEDTKAANARQLKQMQSAYDDQQQALETQDQALMGVIQSGGTQQLAVVTYGQLQLVSAYQNGTDQIIAAVQAKLQNANYGGDYGGSGGGDLGSTGGSYSQNGGGSGFGTGLFGTSGSLNDVVGYGAGSLGAASGYGGGSGGYGMFAAEGGVFDKPTLTVLGEKGKEAVIPLKPSGGLPDNLGGGTSFDFSGMTIGAGVSQDVVMAQIKLMGQTIVKAVADSRAGKPVPQH